MKQTQADFDEGYQTALKDIEEKRKQHPDWSMKDIVYDLGYLCPFFPSFWTKGMKRYVVIRTKWGLGYMKALTDKENEKQ